MRKESLLAIQRWRLLAALDQVGGRSVVAIEAPHGYGKTTLVQQWATRSQTPVAVVDLDDDHRDPEVLFTILAEALDLRPGRDQRDSMRRLADLLTSKRTDQLILALDNVHLLNGSAAARLVDLLVRATPRWLRLVLSGQSLPVGVTVVELERRLLRLRASDLAIQASDIAEPAQLAASALEVVRLTDGWPLALRLVDQLHLAGLGAVPEDLIDLLGRYVAEEIAPGVPTDLWDALQDAAEIQSEDWTIVTAVRAVCGLSGGLERLTEGGLPMVTVRRKGLGGTLRLAPVLASHLRDQLWMDHPERGLALRKARAVDLEARGEYEDAFDRLVTLGVREELARFVLRNTQEMVFQGRSDLPEAWMKEFTRSEIETLPEIPMIQALLEASQARFASMDRILEAMEDASPPQLAQDLVKPGLAPWGLLREFTGFTPVPAPKSVTAKGWWGLAGRMNEGLQATAEGRFEDAWAAFELVDRQCAGYPLVDLWCTSGRAWLLWQEGRRDEFIDVVLAKASIWDRPGLATNATAFSYESVLGLALALTGQFDRARACLKESHRKQRRFRGAFIQAQLINLVTLIYIAEAIDDQPLAASLLEEGRELARRVLGAPYLQKVIEDLPAKLEFVDPNHFGLTGGERRVLDLLASHITMPELGDQLKVSANTVRTHVRSIYRKLGVHTRTEAVRVAQKSGLLRS